MRSNSKNTILGVLACGGLGLALTACNGSSNGPNGSSKSVAGTTTPITTGTGTTPVTTGTGTTPITTTTTPTGTGLSSKFLYASNFFSNDVSVYTTAPTVGTLTSSVAAPALTQNTATGGATAQPVFAMADATGNFLFVADSGTNAVDCFSINRTTGALAAAPVPTAMTGLTPYAVQVDPTSKFVYTANLGDNTISAFMVGTGGSLTPCTTPSAPAGGGASALCMDPTGKFLYCANANDGTISTFSIDATGNPTVVGTPTMTGQGPFALVSVNKGSGFVYVANNLDGTVSVFQIGTGGALTAVGAAVVLPNGGSGASALVADPTGSFLYVLDGYGFAAAATNDIASFSINATTGAITPIGTTNTPAGTIPNAIAVNASGTVLYVADGGANTINLFGITPGTGALIAEGTTPAGGDPTSVCTSN